MRNLNWKPECPIFWDYLPEWAQFLTIDEDGDMYCWDAKPEYRTRMQGGRWQGNNIRLEYIGTLPFTPDDFPAYQYIFERP